MNNSAASGATKQDHVLWIGISVVIAAVTAALLMAFSYTSERFETQARVEESFGGWSTGKSKQEHIYLKLALSDGRRVTLSTGQHPKDCAEVVDKVTVQVTIVRNYNHEIVDRFEKLVSNPCKIPGVKA